MVERYIKTIEEHLRKVVASHQRDWDEGLPLFLLAYRASTHDTTGLTPGGLGVSKRHTTTLHPQSDGMEEGYIKTIEEHLRKVVATHQRDWDEALPLFLLAYRASTHDTTGLTRLAQCSGENFDCPATCCLECPQTRNDPHPIMRQSWWTSYTTSTFMADKT
jgi:hypothetical protein